MATLSERQLARTGFQELTRAVFLLMLSCICGLVNSKSVAVNQTTITLDSYYSTDYKVASLPALFQTFSIIGLQSKTTADTLTVLIDGVRNIEVTALQTVAFSDLTGSMIGSQSGKLYWANARNRSFFSDTGALVNPTGTPFVAGKWAGFPAATSAPANESFVVVESVLNSTSQNFNVFKSEASACSKIITKNCANGGDDKIYCLEAQGATKLLFLTYYSLPKCTKLKNSGAISANFTDTDLVSLRVQGQLLSLCKSSATGLSANCKVYDLNTSMFVLDNPDLSIPVKNIDYTLSLTIPVVAFDYVLDWGCSFWTAGDSTSGYNVYHKCASDLPATGLSATQISILPTVTFNRFDRSVWFITDTTAQKYFRMAIGETAALVKLPYCDVYNQELDLCSKCAANTQLLASGGCSEPIKVAVPASAFEAKINSMMLSL